MPIISWTGRYSVSYIEAGRAQVARQPSSGTRSQTEWNIDMRSGRHVIEDKLETGSEISQAGRSVNRYWRIEARFRGRRQNGARNSFRLRG